MGKYELPVSHFSSVNAKWATALEALQLCLKLLPLACRDELCRLLTFMALAADPQEIRLDREVRAAHENTRQPPPQPTHLRFCCVGPPV